MRGIGIVLTGKWGLSSREYPAAPLRHGVARSFHVVASFALSPCLPCLYNLGVCEEPSGAMMWHEPRNRLIHGI